MALPVEEFQEPEVSENAATNVFEVDETMQNHTASGYTAVAIPGRARAHRVALTQPPVACEAVHCGTSTARSSTRSRVGDKPLDSVTLRTISARHDRFDVEPAIPMFPASSTVVLSTVSIPCSEYGTTRTTRDRYDTVTLSPPPAITDTTPFVATCMSLDEPFAKNLRLANCC